jgi:hypothetical protein
MKKTAFIGLVLIFGLTFIFHILVVIKVIPYTIVWGGRLKSDAEMYRFEFVSLGLNLLFTLIILVKAKVLAFRIRDSFVTLALWGMFGMFVLNTVGNILSENPLEKLIFTPVTVLLSTLILVIILTGKSEKP